MNTRRALVSIGMAVGALGFGVGAAAAVDNTTQSDSVVEGSTTTTTTSEAEPTTTTTTTEVAPSTTTATTEVAPSTTPMTEAPPTPSGSDRNEAPFGLCNAFSGRSQPGNSQAWQRLHDQAGGDIEGYCKDVLATHRAEADDDDASEADEDDASEADEQQHTNKHQKSGDKHSGHGHNGKGG